MMGTFAKFYHEKEVALDQTTKKKMFCTSYSKELF